MKYVLLVLALICTTSPAKADFVSEIHEKTDNEFKKMDRNRDKNISKQEYIDALKAEKLDKDTAEKSLAAFKNIDIDSNGKISREEYDRFMNFAIQTIQNVLQMQMQQQQQK